MRRHITTALGILLMMTVITGIIYPLLVTAAAQLIFPRQANGSLIVNNGSNAGSELIGQPFSDPRYFWGRPSATAPAPYNGAASSGSNFGPLNPDLKDAVAARIKALKDADPGNTSPIPVDLVTSSASGLDPDISIAAALYQAPRIARNRGIPEDKILSLIAGHTQGRQFGLLGEPRVNVLTLNLDLDKLPGQSASSRM
jgi:K+-transporting ATPase ATPase C chain